MPVHGALVILARRVTAPPREYYDLVIQPDPDLVYGIFDPIALVWRAQFGEDECRAQLEAWTEIPTNPQDRDQPSSQVTEEGRHWLQHGWHIRGDEV